MGNSPSSTGAAATATHPPSEAQVDDVFESLVATYHSKVQGLFLNESIDEDLLLQCLRIKLTQLKPLGIEGVARIESDITCCIHQTPLVKIRTVLEEEVEIEEQAQVVAEVVAKVEYLSPGFSVKDRIALQMIQDAERKGLIKPGKQGTTVIDITSGNTGIGLGLVCAVKGYPCVQVIPEPYSVERRALMMALGVEVVVTPASAGIAGALKKYIELCQNYGDRGWTPRQFDNPANIDAHFQHTGPEIWEQCGGKVDAIVAAYGTGGTISGVTKFLRQKNPNFIAICVEPLESSLLNGDTPAPHGIQGISPPFVPDNALVELFDEVIRCPTEKAMKMARAMAKNEGILAGISAGANVWAAQQVAKRPEMKGKRIVTILPSAAERYFSTPLYSEIMEQAKQIPLASIVDSIPLHTMGINLNNLETFKKAGKLRPGFHVV